MSNNRHLQEVLIFLFNSKNTKTAAHQQFQKVYDAVVLTKTTCRDWFRHFKDSDFDVEDSPLEGRPIFEDAVKCQMQEKPFFSIRSYIDVGLLD